MIRKKKKNERDRKRERRGERGIVRESKSKRENIKNRDKGNCLLREIVAN